MTDLKTIETFVWVATLRSFRGAAKKLAMTQPAVSIRIKQLEDTLGVRLLERDRRHVTPTQKGQELLRHAQRLMRLHTDMIEEIGNAEVMGGLLRLGVSETIVHTWLPALLERVNAAYPKLELEIEVDISPNLRDRLVTRDIDVALLLGPISHPNIHSRPLCSFPLAFVASDKIRLPRRTLPLETIAEWPIITFSRNTQPHVAIRDMFDRAGLWATIHASASLATIVRMALDGLGIAVLPPAILDTVSAFGQLRRLQTTVRLPKLNFVVGLPSLRGNLAAQRVAEIATKIAQERVGVIR
jgi:DNA-binding transcriptional LysR family regulator